MQPTNPQKKDTIKPTIETGKSSTTNTVKNDFTNTTTQKADNENFEGDEREWQAPDVKPKYPTDVQAKATKLETNNRPANDEMADYAMSQDEDDQILGTENPGLMNRH